MTVSIRYGMPERPTSGITPYRSIVVHTPPTVEPVTLSEAKVHAKVDVSDDDTYIASLITMSRQYVESVLDTSLINQTLEARYDVFPLWELILPRPPMSPAAVTVIYRDEAGRQNTITSSAGQFQVDSNVIPGRIYPNYESVWPAVRGDENSVLVRWVAGYGASSASVPAVTKHLILLQVAHLYEMRQPVIAGYSQILPVPQTFDALLAASGWGGYR
jgi:uncharacterized phiE125 gp8 family phage protein